jgi:hypothetical protein
MTITSVSVEAVRIANIDSIGLDPICVFWQDVGPGQGYCTITCYGAAWTVYFGGMNGRTIRQFFAEAGTDYLVTKMGITPHLKQTKRDNAYLTRIINAVKQSLAHQEQAA